MANEYYTHETNALILVALLKQYGIKKVIASPGTGNMAFVVSMQHDSFFEMYSCVDERSAAYMACGMASESGEPVVITCTEATASRNYLPGLTEAYYRKLPILAIMASRGENRIGVYEPQSIDNRTLPNDIAKHCIHIPICKNAQDVGYVETRINEAIYNLFTKGGGPVCITLESYSMFSADYSVKKLPTVRIIKNIHCAQQLPTLPEKGRIVILVGAHHKWSNEQIKTIDLFCEKNNAAVLCDLTSNYTGKYRVNYALVAAQEGCSRILPEINLLIYIGTVCGDYYTAKAMCVAKDWWMVSEDETYHDRYNNLSTVISMNEIDFFAHYLNRETTDISFYQELSKQYQEIFDKLPDLPFSNIWIAQIASKEIPEGCVIHTAINNSFRSWNFFKLPQSVTGNCNVGGFGIDGGLSTLIGASLLYPKKIYFGILGDLAFFYDMNVLGNRHVGNNLRLLLINNGKGQEFRNYQHPASLLGDDADKYVAAGGHFGQQSQSLVKNYAENLGFTYYTASNKEQFLEVYKIFFNDQLSKKPIVFEVFTNHVEENEALHLLRFIVKPLIDTKKVIKNAFGVKGVKILRAVKDSLDS